MGDLGPLEIALGVTVLAFAGLMALSWLRGPQEPSSGPARGRRGRSRTTRPPGPPEEAASASASAPASRAAAGGSDSAPAAASNAPSAPRRAAQASDGEALVQLHGVERSYSDSDGRAVLAVRSANLSVHAGQMVALIGPSGLGKSTLLNILGAIDFPTTGTVVHRGRALPQEECAEIRRYRAEQVCFVFQDLNLVTHLTAEENAALPLLCRGVERGAALAEARRRLDELGLQGLAHRRAHQLSGGQRQRVAIARAFTSRAPLLLADEPTGSLDPETAGAVIEAFARRARDEGRTVILVTHNPELARRWCDRVIEVTTHGLVEQAADDAPRAATERPRPRPEEALS